MKYRNKLYLIFLGISFFVVLLTIVLIVVQARSYVFKQLQNEVMAIAASAASEIDVDLVQELKVKEDEQKPAYEQLRQSLRKIRNANRNSTIYIKFIYVIYPSPIDPKKFIFAVDAEENEKDVSHTGDENPGPTLDRLYNHLNEPYSYNKLVRDQWGVWLTGYSPIYNSQGKYVATIGVDISAAFVHGALNKLILSGGIAFAISLLLTIIGANYLARKSTSSLNALSEGAKEIGKGNYTHQIQLNTNDEFQEVATAMNTMAKGIREKERIRQGFAHYVSQHALEKVSASKGVSRLGGEKRKITVFFSDIRNFASLSEKLSPDEIVSILNDYFNTMLEVVFKHNGMFDKFVSDAIMVEFGVLQLDPNQEKNAVFTALEMLTAMDVLRAKWKSEGKPEVELGIGIHTGEALVGSIGTEGRMEFTAIGDTINIVSELEKATRQFNQSIIVSEATFTGLNNEFPSKPLGPLTIEGKTPINIFAILPRGS